MKTKDKNGLRTKKYRRLCSKRWRDSHKAHCYEYHKQYMLRRKARVLALLSTPETDQTLDGGVETERSVVDVDGIVV